MACLLFYLCIRIYILTLMNLIIVFLDIKKHNILQIRIEGNKTLIKESMTNIKNQKTKDQSTNTKSKEDQSTIFLGWREKRKGRKKGSSVTNHLTIDDTRCAS